MGISVKSIKIMKKNMSTIFLSKMMSILMVTIIGSFIAFRIVIKGLLKDLLLLILSRKLRFLVMACLSPYFQERNGKDKDKVGSKVAVRSHLVVLISPVAIMKTITILVSHFNMNLSMMMIRYISH